MPQLIDDIVLFFSQNGRTRAVSIPRTTYAERRLRAEVVSSYWNKALLLEESNEGGAPFFVTNLSQLEDPGVADDGGPPAEPPEPTTEVPGSGDLVVFPWNDQDNAYLVPRSVYEQLPDLDESINADLLFMALNEGVVLANVPKHDLVGATCFLLNLLALRSYPPPAVG